MFTGLVSVSLVILPRSLLFDPFLFDLILIRVVLNFLTTLLRYFVEALHVTPVSFLLILPVLRRDVRETLGH